jgi:hypothetical protein
MVYLSTRNLIEKIVFSLEEDSLRRGAESPKNHHFHWKLWGGALNG